MNFTDLILEGYDVEVFTPTKEDLHAPWHGEGYSATSIGGYGLGVGHGSSCHHSLDSTPVHTVPPLRWHTPDPPVWSVRGTGPGATGNTCKSVYPVPIWRLS